MHFFNVWGFLALLAIPAIIVMYLLKQKYKEIHVPSLFLWKQAVAQSKAHKPWQKLKKNLLLFLQIAAVLFLALALANPYMTGGKKSQNYVFALDQSMSMQAKDVSPSRFEKAKQQIKKMIEQAPPGTEVSIVTMGENPYIALNSTKDKKMAQNQLSKIEATNAGVDFEKVVSLLELQKEQTQGLIYVFTDTEYDFGKMQVHKIPFGTSQENCAITVLSHSKKEQVTTVLAKVKNFGTSFADKTITLYCDDSVFDVQEARLEAGEEREFYFQSIPNNTTKLMVKITPEDILSADDIAYDVLETQSKQKVLFVSEQNLFIEKMMNLLSNVELYKTTPENIENLKGYSLYIFDGVLPEVLPSDGHSLILNPPEGNTFLDTEQAQEITQPLVQTNHSLLGNMKIQFAVSKAKKVTLPIWAQTIIYAGEFPLMFAGEYENKKIAVFAFDIHDSDLPLKKEFPIFMYQLADWFFPKNNTNLEKITAGNAITIHMLPESKKVTVIDPKSNSVLLAPPFPAAPFQSTNETGFYTLLQEKEQGEQVESYFAVNAKVQGESELLPMQKTDSKIIQNSEFPANRSLKVLFLLVLLAVIVGEWWVNCHEY